MVVLSTLRPFLSAGIARTTQQLCRTPQLAKTAPVRYGGGGPSKMVIRPTQFQTNRFKDDLHFYVLLGAVPLIAVVVLSNVYIGQATLSDAPDDYEPKEWEYYKHPIERWFVRMFYTPMKDSYERAACECYIESEKIKYRKLKSKAEVLMSQRGDYKAWYYVPSNMNVLVAGKKHAEQIYSDSGTEQ